MKNSHSNLNSAKDFMKCFTRLLTCLAAGLASVSAEPLGTAFTYQGKLNDNGQPASGVYDFVFALYNSPTNEVPIYSGVLNDDVAVTNGLFTTEIDFGADLFTGEALWLGVGVRPGDETGDVTQLSPRHSLSATPYAHFARRAAVADTANTVSNVNWTAVKNLPPSLADGLDDNTTYTAGAGLSLSAENQFRVSYAGHGIASTAARSDHGHFGGEWIGSTNNAPGLRIQNSSNTGIGMWGKNDQYGSGFSPWNGAGVFGDSSPARAFTAGSARSSEPTTPSRVKTPRPPDGRWPAMPPQPTAPTLACWARRPPRPAAWACADMPRPPKV
jgi:hypothetical protein